MRRIVVICEGQTEEAFISRVLVPATIEFGIHLQGITVETSRGCKGGGLKYARLLLAVRNALASGNVAAVATLIDLYKLATDFPGYAEAMVQPHLSARLQTLELRLHQDVVAKVGCDQARFVPHIQPHEFEALLFSDIGALCSVESGWASSAPALQATRASAATPEEINGGDLTKPSSRLDAILRNPSYRKLRHGPIATERIGLAKIEAECLHFASWLAKLRQL